MDAAADMSQRRLERERRARMEAERIAEEATRELYETVVALQRSERELTEAAALVNMLQRVTVAANQAAGLDEAARVALAEVCEYAGWPVGHLYVTDASGVLVPSRVWHLTDPAASERFVTVTEGCPLRAGEGLPGRVLATGRPASICNVHADGNFPRANRAPDIEVRSGFAFPVLTGGEVVAVLEFFAFAPTEPRSGLLEVMAQVGTQLGHVVERRAFQDQLAHQSLHDALTGLPNRALFLDRVRHAQSRARRAGTPLAVLFIDLDGFKAVNDSFGHDAGNQLLQQVSVRIPGSLRPGDTLARLSGDEFAVLCEDVQDEQAVMAVAHRILATLTAPFNLSNTEAFVSASIGVAVTSGRGTAPHERITAEGLLSDADLAMYRAKDTGKGTCVLFERSLRQRIQERLGTERALRAGIEQGQLRVHYQPLVDLRDGGLTGFEALVRWQHPERGLLTAGEFVPLAEDSALITRIGEWMLGAVCRTMSAWHAAGHPVTVAVNVSVRELEQGHLVDLIDGLLQAHHVPASSLLLEITESALTHDSTAVLHQLHSLRKLGVRLSLDDFGTGYSSLDRLRTMPVESLKIDQSFVRDMPATPGGTALVAAIIAMAHSLGLAVIAEGVETDQQLRRLHELGCDQVQGYLLGRPQDLHDTDPGRAAPTSWLAGGPDPELSLEGEIAQLVISAVKDDRDIDRTTRSLVTELRRLATLMTLPHPTPAGDDLITSTAHEAAR